MFECFQPTVQVLYSANKCFQPTVQVLQSVYKLIQPTMLACVQVPYNAVYSLNYWMCNIDWICLAGVFSQGSWMLLNDLKDPELKILASKLPSTILHSRADSTTKKYLGPFRRWKTWATSHSLASIPAKPHEVALYLQHVAEETRSKSAAEEACHALAWVHSTAGLSSPSSHPFVKATLEGLQRSLAKPVMKKEPITLEMLEAKVDDANESGSLSNQHLATACLLSFAGFLRFDKLINLRSCDFTFSQLMLSIRVLRSKTNQLRHGDEV